VTDEEMYKQYESMVEAVVLEDFDKYESKILAQSTFSSVQQLRLLTRLRERLRPVQIPEHCKSKEESYTNDHSYFLRQHGRGG
jgi:hypothetical protein